MDKIYYVIFAAAVVLIGFVWLIVKSRKVEKNFENLIDEKQKTTERYKQGLFLMILFYVLTAAVNFNEHLSVEYNGHFQGAYQISVYNLQPCPVLIDVNYNQNRDTTFNINAGTKKNFSLPGDYIPNSLIRVRTKDKCISAANAGWIDILVPGALPIKIEKFEGNQVYNTIHLKFRIHVPANEDLIIEKSYDGRVWQTVFTYHNVNPQTLDETWIDNKPKTYNFYRVGGRVLFVLFEFQNLPFQVYTLNGQYLKEIKAISTHEALQQLSPGTYVLKQNGSTIKIRK